MSIKYDELYLLISVASHKKAWLYQHLVEFRKSLPLMPSISQRRSKEGDFTLMLKWEINDHINGYHVHGTRYILWEYFLLYSLNFWQNIKNFTPYFVHEVLSLGAPFCPFLLLSPIPPAISKKEWKRKYGMAFDLYIKEFETLLEIENHISMDEVERFYHQTVAKVLAMQVGSNESATKDSTLNPLQHNSLMIKDYFPCSVLGMNQYSQILKYEISQNINDNDYSFVSQRIHVMNGIDYIGVQTGSQVPEDKP